MKTQNKDLSHADLNHAELSGADLRDANLSDADWTATKADLFEVLSAAVPEIPALKKAMLDGLIDGCLYEGDCCCLIGTLCKAGAKLEGIVNRPIERLFLAIRPGHTPDNHPISSLIWGWMQEFETTTKP